MSNEQLRQDLASRIEPPDVSSLLPQVLEAMGWRQADLARALGVSAMAVSDWINGKRYPKPEYLRRIASLPRD